MSLDSPPMRAEPRADERRLVRRIVKKPDGRYLIYYERASQKA